MNANRNKIDSFEMAQAILNEVDQDHSVFLLPADDKVPYANCENCPNTHGKDDPHYDVCECLPANGGSGVCHGARAATQDLAVLMMWAKMYPNSRVAVATGLPSNNDVVLEWDPKNGGEESWKALLDEHGSLQITRVDRSPSQGDHYWLNLPEGMPSQNIHGKLGKGIDIKADGGYAVVWGPGYFTCVVDAEVAPAPQWFSDYIHSYMNPAPRPRLQRNNPVTLDLESDSVKETAQATVKYWLGRVISAEDGIQNTLLYVASRVLGSLVYYELCDEEDARCLLEDAADEGGHPAYRALGTINSGFNTGLRSPDELDDLVNPDRMLIKAFTWDDFGNATRVVFYEGDDLRYDSKRNQFYIWLGTHWEESSEADVTTLVQKVLSAMISREAEFYSNEVLEKPEDGKKKPLTPRESFRAWARTQRFSRKVQDCLRSLKAHPDIRISNEDFDQQPYKLNLANGVLDLNTLEMAPHDREFLFTTVLGTGYDEKASCDNWERFIKIAMPNQRHRKYLQRLAGLTLLGEAVEQRFILNVGEGGRGKGVFHEVMGGLLESYARKSDRKAFLGQGSQRTFEMYQWEGKRMVYADEIGGGKLNGEFLKEITGAGGGKLIVEGKGVKHKEFVPQFTVWLCSNHLPQMTNEAAMERRFLLVKWLGEKLTADQWETFKDRENRLVSRFFLAHEASGILNWLLKGLQDYLDHGLNIPSDWDEEAKALLVESDMEAQFVRENLEITGNPADTADQKTVFAAYEQFFTENADSESRNQKLGKINFNKKLVENMKFTRDYANNRPQWVGVRLKTHPLGKSK